MVNAHPMRLCMILYVGICVHFVLCTKNKCLAVSQWQLYFQRRKPSMLQIIVFADIFVHRHSKCDREEKGGSENNKKRIVRKPLLSKKNENKTPDFI